MNTVKEFYGEIREFTDERPVLFGVLSWLWLFFAPLNVDIWLRKSIAELDFYGLEALQPNLFAALWAIVLAVLATLPASHARRRILWGTGYFLFAAYAVIQSVAWRMLGKFLYLTDFLYAGDAADFSLWILDFLDGEFVHSVTVLVLSGLAGILFVPGKRPWLSVKSGRMIRLLLAGLCVAGTFLVPLSYPSTRSDTDWDAFRNPKLEYEKFTNANFDMQLTGPGQFLFRDVQIQLRRLLPPDSRLVKEIDGFFAEVPAHEDNAMTGYFAGKNLIVVMMESIDSWLINENDTPTLWKMMNEGINFTRLYTPEYSNGYTFNTEFAFSTSIYPYANGNAAYTLGRNGFPRAFARVFADAGYRANSYHEGEGEYYNRTQMHRAFGYSRYHSYTDYPEIDMAIINDRYLTHNDALYADLTGSGGEETPFLSYVITFSAHLPYNNHDEMSRHALSEYPQYDTRQNRETNILRAKAHITDDMFADLLARLEEDGLLEDTVICAFADHYAYGIEETGRLTYLKVNAGRGEIWENTPAFVWSAGGEALTVDKTMQITDLGPTLMNLFGLDVPANLLGRDVFDESYAGWAIFPGDTWITDLAYMKNGRLVYNNGMSDEEIAAMNAYVTRVYTVNDAILDTDYYHQ